MTKVRLLALPLTLAIALAGTSAVLAQDDSAESDEMDTPFVDTGFVDPLVAYAWLENLLLAQGIAEEDIDEAITEVQAAFDNLSEEDVEDLAELFVASEGISRLTDEIGDGDFGFLGDDDDMDDDAEDDDGE